jgi:electron transport complex protein RnfG
MVGVGLGCGLLIVGVYQLTKPAIERNEAEALQRAILHVLPEARSSATFLLDEDGGFTALAAEEPLAPTAEVVHAGYDEGGRLTGLAIEARGMGYQDVIRLLYGYSHERQAVVGIRILESKETPGLGDRIGTDPAFLANFEALDVRLDGGAAGLANRIEAVKSGEKESAWQVDGITGATISSEAVADMLDRSADAWIPRIRARLDDFRVAEAP